MPLYEYRCTSCGYSFEKIQNFSATPETECPKCQGVLIRPVTAPALRFEGAGWYVNDYAGKGGAKNGEAPTADSNTDSKDAKSTTGTEAVVTPAASPTTASPASTPAPAASPTTS